MMAVPPGASAAPTRLARSLRARGLAASVSRAWQRATGRISLEAAAARQRLVAGRLPSDREVLSPGTWPSVAAWLQHLSTAATPALPLPPTPGEEFAAAMSGPYAANRQATIDAADRICRHEVRLLGHEMCSGGPLPWHRDPATAWEWPRQYVGKLDRWVWREDTPADLKLPWELSRHQYLVTLAKAAWVTDDERYASECAAIVVDWVRENPAGIGINWYSALELGVRLISWCLAFRFLRGSRAFREQAGDAFVRSVRQQASFLADHLTIGHAVRNNHIIGETAGLIVTAATFPEMTGASTWLDTGLRLFTAELADQTFSDGMNKEQAPAYHRFVLDFALLVAALARGGAIPPQPRVEALLQSMLEYALSVTTPAGDIPTLGDADDGRGYCLDETPGCGPFGDALSAGAVMFDRPDFGWAAGAFAEAAFWLLGPEARRAFEAMAARPPSTTSAAFVPGGHYVIRDGWRPDSDYALFRCGPFGWGGAGLCAHSHCDLLSPIIVLKGEPFLVDSGTYTYHGPERQAFRLTAAHNTIMIDGVEQARPTGAFSWTGVPEARCLHWDGRRVIAAMECAGVTHRRSVERQAAAWVIEDAFEGEGTHVIEWFFHLGPRWRLEVGETVLARGPVGIVACEVDPRIGLAADSGWASPSYLVREHTDVLIGKWRGSLPPLAVFRWRFCQPTP